MRACVGVCLSVAKNKLKNTSVRILILVSPMLVSGQKTSVMGGHVVFVPGHNATSALPTSWPGSKDRDDAYNVCRLCVCVSV